MRQLALDTETTGLDPSTGHRIIEIACVEIVNRQLTGKQFHCYCNPEREVDLEAIQVHGLKQEFLADKPTFIQSLPDLLAFIDGAELVIHNAAFDLAFLDKELELAQHSLRRIQDRSAVIDTLALARRLHPGQRNSLDALCKRYKVNNAQRTLHGALLDAQLLAQVYLAMTGGQGSLFDGMEVGISTVLHPSGAREGTALPARDMPLRVIFANEEELAAHHAYYQQILCDKK